MITLDKKALVLFSGGQDSTTCLAWALAHFDKVETVGFDYGQRHIIELECRPKILAAIKNHFPAWAHKLGPDHMIDLTNLGSISETALTREIEITLHEKNLPNTFVPGRNLIFFTYAAALAYRRRILNLIGGMCQTDYSGYPDCRDDTIKCLQTAINLGMDRHFHIHTPLMFIDKAHTLKLAYDIGGEKLFQILIEETHSCYMGDRTHKHDWGFGCGTCPACELRQGGFKKYSADHVK